MGEIVLALWIIAVAAIVTGASVFAVAIRMCKREKPARSVVAVASQSPFDVLESEHRKSKPVTISNIGGIVPKGGVIHMTDEYETQVLKGLDQ